MSAARIAGSQLLATISGRDFVIATATRRFDGLYKWHGFGRSGTGKFDSAETALRAAARAMGWKIDAAAKVSA